MSDWLVENLDPKHEAEFRKSEEQCLKSNIDQFKEINLDKYFKKGYESVKEEIPRSVLQWTGEMGRRATPTIPWHVYGVSLKL
jgi:hypothetical protein